jgi:hypothetical protein
VEMDRKIGLLKFPPKVSSVGNKPSTPKGSFNEGEKMGGKILFGIVYAIGIAIWHNHINNHCRIGF